MTGAAAAWTRQLACLALSAAAAGASAMWASLDDETLIRTSDLVVMGEWLGPNSDAPGIGTVAVSETLKGVSKPASVRIALPSAQAPRSSSDPLFRYGDRGLWLLRLQPGSKELYLADHPQRFVPVAGGAARIRQLRRQLTP